MTVVSTTHKLDESPFLELLLADGPFGDLFGRDGEIRVTAFPSSDGESFRLTIKENPSTVYLNVVDATALRDALDAYIETQKPAIPEWSHPGTYDGPGKRPPTYTTGDKVREGDKTWVAIANCDGTVAPSLHANTSWDSHWRLVE